MDFLALHRIKIRIYLLVFRRLIDFVLFCDILGKINHHSLNVGLCAKSKINFMFFVDGCDLYRARMYLNLEFTFL